MAEVLLFRLETKRLVSLHDPEVAVRVIVESDRIKTEIRAQATLCFRAHLLSGLDVVKSCRGKRLRRSFLISPIANNVHIRRIVDANRGRHRRRVEFPLLNRQYLRGACRHEHNVDQALRDNLTHLIPILGQRTVCAIAILSCRLDAESHVGVLGVGQDKNRARRIFLKSCELHFESFIHFSPSTTETGRNSREPRQERSVFVRVTYVRGFPAVRHPGPNPLSQEHKRTGRVRYRAKTVTIEVLYNKISQKRLRSRKATFLGENCRQTLLVKICASHVAFHSMKSDASNGGARRSDKRSYTIRSVARAAATLKAFSSPGEVLLLRAVVERTQLDKGTVFRLLETLVETGLIVRVGKQGYRSNLHPIHTRRFRIGYASQSNLLPFTGIVTDSLLSAASRADIDLVVLNNQFSPRVALENAKRFVEEKVDLVIDSQINVNVASQIGATLLDGGIPFIAVDIPHPGSFYFGADNYKAGRIAGRHLARWALKKWHGNVDEVIYLGVDAAGPLLNSRLTGMSDGLNETMPELRNFPTCHYDTKGGQFDATLDAIRKHLRRRKVRRVLVGR